MRKIWLIGAGLALAVAGGFTVFGSRLAGQDGPAQEKTEVLPPLSFSASEVAQPRLMSMPTELVFSGPLVAPGSAVLRARAAGTLTTLSVAEGERVRAGQVLGHVDLAEVASRVAEREANVAAARAALAQAQRTQAQNERLAGQQFISTAALDASRAGLQTAQAQLDAPLAATAASRVALREATLVAPIAGIVAKRLALPGEKLAVEQPVLSIVDLRRLELAASVGTHEVARLAAGMPVQLQVEGVDQALAGQIARIAPAAEPGTRVIGVTIALANPGERLRAGQYAVATATLADDRERLAVPQTAISTVSGQDQVWLIEDGKLARRAVKLGRRDARSGQVEVSAGLTPAAQVVAARFDGLSEGRTARIAPAQTVAASSAASAAQRLQ
jgi:RND family efflux transporter MFP subunit